MAPCSSKIKGYKGVITYVQKRGLKKMKYGYARVSTRQQDLEGQLRQLEENAAIGFTSKKLPEQKVIAPNFKNSFRKSRRGIR